MSWLRAFLGLLLILNLAVALSACSANSVPTLNLTILHTNNIEGELDPCSCLSDPAGGAARRSNAVSGLRGQFPDLFLVDAGDALFGTPVADASYGLAMVSSMNAMGYDAAVLGDEEFSYGLDVLQTIIDTAEYPYLAANIVYKDTGQPLVQGSVILERSGYRVAFLGLTTMDVDQLLQADETLGSTLTVLDPIRTAREQVPELRKQADAVIVLSHLGSDLDRKLVARVSGIAAVIGGHSREVLTTGETTTKAPIVQMGYQGDELGILSIGVTDKGKTVTAHSDSVLLNHEVESDETVQALLLPHKARAALFEVVDFSEGLSPLLPLEVHRADRDTQRAYLGALAFPELYQAEVQPGTVTGENASLLACFLNDVGEQGPYDFSLMAVTTSECIQQGNRILDHLPEPEVPIRVDTPDICK